MDKAFNNSLSIVVPAFNEAENIEATIVNIMEASGSLPGDFEIIVVNDCSTDQTRQISEQLSAKYRALKVINNPSNLGFGGSYKRGLEEAMMANTIMIPGDDAYPRPSLCAIFEKVGTSKILMTYTTNTEVRPIGRRIISQMFVTGMNLIFGLRLKYYNGVTVLPTVTAQKMNPSDGFSYASENLVRLIKLHQYSYQQIPAIITERKAGQTKAFSSKNILSVVRGVIQLWLDVYVRSFEGSSTEKSDERT
jgi:glycosyltransferase involved in cell wall biosynthesis